MRTRVAHIFVVILTWANLWSPVLAQDFRAINQAVDPAVGRVVSKVYDGYGSGSGFIIGKRNGQLLFVTNSHVVEGAQEVFVGFRQSGELFLYDATVVRKVEDEDLALLRLRPNPDNPAGHKPKTLSIATQAEKGQQVAAIGFPSLSDAVSDGVADPSFFESTLTTGNVSRVTRGRFSNDGRKLSIIQHTADINKGNSGGPLVDMCGDVIGVNTLKAAFHPELGEVPQGTNWSSGGETVLSFLVDAGQSIEPKTTACRANGSAPAQLSDPVPSEDLTPFYIFLALLGMAGISSISIVILRKRIAKYQLVKSGSRGPQRDAPVLVVEIDGQAKPLTAGALKNGVLIGRESSADLAVELRELSRQHARLTLKDRRLMIEDLGSSNGTTVDGSALEARKPVQINTKSRVKLANHLMTLRRP